MTNFSLCGIILALTIPRELSKSPIDLQTANMNPLRKSREKLLMSKAELARKSGLSYLTVDRIKKGMTCRLETKRKIIFALGLQLSDRGKIFGDEKS